MLSIVSLSVIANSFKIGDQKVPSQIFGSVFVIVDRCPNHFDNGSLMMVLGSEVVVQGFKSC